MIALAITTSSKAQVGIGVSTANINPSAQLDVVSTTKGFLPPRMTEAQRNLLAVTSASVGLIIYCSDCGSNGGEPECYNGSAWVSMIALFGSLPTLAPTISITAISNESATSGGNIHADGNATVTGRGVCWSTSSNPTIALSTKTIDGAGIGSFTSSITGLNDSTTYYVRSYSTNAGGTAYGNEVVFTTAILGTIGTQVWTTQNLNVSVYRDGTPIPKVENAATWASGYGAYCYYNNDSATYASIYGKLYNWYAVHDSAHGGLAPTGYHIPSDSEWTTLTAYLGGTAVAGGKLKDAGTTRWTTPNTGATNSSGFIGLPGGNRYNNGTFYYIGTEGYWWSSTEANTASAWYRIMYYSSGNVFRGSSTKASGFSVRCIRD